MMSTTRAGRGSKDKTQKTQPTQNVKSDMNTNMNTKNQPTAEQMRLATMINSEKNEEDPEVQAKIKQVIETTGRSEDDAFFALHDCDFDLNRAVNKLLENTNEVEWEKASSKKKKQSNKQNDTNTITNSDTKPDRPERGEGDRGSGRGRRDRGPPRFQRGRGRDNSNHIDGNRGERDGDSRSRDRSFEGRGKGRGRGGSKGRGRGRGGGGGGGGGYRGERNNMQSQGFDANNTSGGSGSFESGPHIDTWTNETAENAEKKNMQMGSWSEDWEADAWTGNLDETKVFTATSLNDSGASKNVFSSDNDAKMFSVSAIETQVFNSSSLSNTAPLADSTNTYSALGGSAGAIGSGNAGTIGQNTLGGGNQGAGTIGQNSLGQKAMGPQNQTPTLGQRLNIEDLLPKAAETPPAPQGLSGTDFLAQYTKQAEEDIKNAVGIRSSPAPGSRVPGMAPTSSSMPPPAHQPPQPQRQPPSQQQPGPPKSQKTRLPPPSKIPASAVEMPGSMNFNVDVQFGNWEMSDGFSFGSSAPAPESNNNHGSFNSSGGSASLANHKPANDTAQSLAPGSANSTKTGGMGLDNMGGNNLTTSQSPRPGAGNSVFPNNTPQTPPKDYSQSNKMVSPPDPILFPSSQERKSSPYASQRGPSQTGSLSSSKPVSSPAVISSYNQAGYSSSAYQSSYKTGYQQSGSTSQYQSGTGYQSTGAPSFQSQSASSGSTDRGTSGSYSAGGSSSGSQTGGSSSLYQSSTNQTAAAASSFQAPSAGSTGSSSQDKYPGQSQSSASSVYQSPSAGSYSSSGTYQSSRDSSYQTPAATQSGAPGFQTGSSSSQAGSSYPSDRSASGSGGYQTGSSPAAGSGGGSSNYPASAVSQPSSYRDNQASSQYSYGSSQPALNKLTNSLDKMAVKDNSLDSSASRYSADSTRQQSSSVSLSSTTSTTSSSLASASLGLNSALAAATATAVTSNTPIKSTMPITTKAPPNLPPGVPPVLGPNYMISQPGLPATAFYGLQGLNIPQQPMNMYSYEDLQLLQRLPLTTPYYDQPPSFQQQPATAAGAPTATLAGGAPTIEPANKIGGSAPTNYSAVDGKLSTRLEAQSPVNATQPAQQQQSQSAAVAAAAAAAAHNQQAFINPTLPPGYINNYYYPSSAAVLQGGYYNTAPPAMFPMPSVTNAAHGGTTGANAQFQKPAAATAAYPSYNTGYDNLAAAGQTQDFNKSYVSQTQTKASSSVSAAGSSALSDLAGGPGGNAAYAAKTHTAAYDKSGGFHHAGTPPPPFSTLLPTGSSTQAGPLAAPYGAPHYVPVVAHQPHNQMLHHHLQQDSTGSSRGAGQTSTAGKPAGAQKYNPPYWPN